MQKKQGELRDTDRVMEILVSGHLVHLSFSAEYNPTAATLVRNCLIDDYIRRVRPEFAEDQENQ